MIEARARVIALDGDHVLVEASVAGGCSACAAHSGCAASKLGKLLRQTPRLWRVPNDQGLQRGDSVILSVPEEALLAAALAAYLPPLLGLLAGALLAAALAKGDVWPLAGAIAGFLLGAAAAHGFGRLQAARYAPLVQRQAPSPAAVPIRFT
jgi:sigma-E factor negative regulatory protein RseC